MNEEKLSDALSRLILLSDVTHTAFLKAKYARKEYEDAEVAARKAEKAASDFADELIKAILNSDLSKLGGF